MITYTTLSLYHQQQHDDLVHLRIISVLTFGVKINVFKINYKYIFLVSKDIH